MTPNPSHPLPSEPDLAAYEADAIRAMADKLHEDLVFSAPEVWKLKIKVRMEDLIDLVDEVRAETGSRTEPDLAALREALDVERLRDAMYDADSGCSGIPGECCAPSTHADAEAIAAAYLATAPTEADRLATYEAALASGLSDAEAREEGWPR